MWETAHLLRRHDAGEFLAVHTPPRELNRARRGWGWNAGGQCTGVLHRCIIACVDATTWGLLTAVPLAGAVGALLGAGIGVVVGWWIFFRRRQITADTNARLERIEHMLAAPDQAWYWTPEWQAGEAEADADLMSGRSTKFDSDTQFLAALDSVPAVDEPTRTAR